MKHPFVSKSGQVKHEWSARLLGIATGHRTLGCQKKNNLRMAKEEVTRIAQRVLRVLVLSTQSDN